MKLWHVYVLIGIAGFFATGSQALEYFTSGDGPIDGTEQFWRDAITANNASLFLVFDVVILGLALFVWMSVESRKVDIGAGFFVGYVPLSILVGISTFVPFFLAHRQRLLDAQKAVTASQ
ncbi:MULTISPECIES: DUF2834 domain-containing protein [unclassified Nocardioides]|uniref:DUF2834 domain-containing protein n=1 Tax=unclassified Nocardioides TaxID=2615069 RepID=UPI000AD386A2|nr:MULTISPECIES: DUF2834 domain-containing protein [unclassified Nocardioides]